MEESCQRESLSSFRNASDVAYYVRNKVELCLQNYMSLEVTAKYLKKNHNICKTLTHLVWEQLRKENPVFFAHLDLRSQMFVQMRMFSDMLIKQAVLMFETKLLHISDASPSVKTLLRRKHPQRVHLLETLAPKRELSSASLPLPYANGSLVAQSQNPYDQQDHVLNGPSFAMPDPNGPSVAQPQILYNQQDQVLNPASFSMPNPSVPSAAQWQIPNEQLNQHLYASSLALSNANGISVTQLPIPYDQQEQPLYTTSVPLPASNGPSMPQLPVPLPTYNDHISPTFAPADTDDWFLLTDPAFDDLGALPPSPPADTNQWPSPDDLAYTATMPEAGPSTFEVGGNIGHNGRSFMEADTVIAVTHLNEHYQPQWQQQQNVQVEGSNGDTIEELLSDNFHITYTSVHEQQALVMHPSEQPQHQNGHDQPQQNDLVETLQRGGSSNGVVNGESIDHELCNNFGKKQSKRMCTSVDEQQAGRVKRHHPESEALYDPNTDESNDKVPERVGAI